MLYNKKSLVLMGETLQKNQIFEWPATLSDYVRIYICPPVSLLDYIPNAPPPHLIYPIPN